MSSNRNIREQIKDTVLQVDPDAEVILFGSRARGDYSIESDWDVLVLTEQDERNSAFRRSIRNALYHLELELGIIITAVVSNKAVWNAELSESPLFWEVQKDGIVL